MWDVHHHHHLLHVHNIKLLFQNDEAKVTCDTHRWLGRLFLFPYHEWCIHIGWFSYAEFGSIYEKHFNLKMTFRFNYMDQLMKTNYVFRQTKFSTIWFHLYWNRIQQQYIILCWRNSLRIDIYHSYCKFREMLWL